MKKDYYFFMADSFTVKQFDDDAAAKAAAEADEAVIRVQAAEQSRVVFERQPKSE